ncbi:MAG: DUF2459 domain-containing protein [Bacteroidales bacterium]|jgi:uncharacterized protein (TIGR02117 family)|nr:DUF2459 domain-containing protein [Bacteroidales bacterium]
MIKAIRKIAKWIIAIILFPFAYFLLSLILTFIPVNNKQDYSEKTSSIYLNSNGVHLNIIIAKNQLDTELLDGLRFLKNDNYFSFGWGDRKFYLNTPEWSDLTFNNAFQALFLKSQTLIHLTRYSTSETDWVEINVTQHQLDKINQYIYKSFYSDSLNNKILLHYKGYSQNDDFYEAVGTYSCFKTSNSWVNKGLNQSDIKACLWTPFDFGLLRIHRK